MNNYSKRHADLGFTLLELLVVVAIIALLVALLAPSLRGALEATRAATCGSHLSKISQALALFAGDNPAKRTNAFSAERWPAQLSQYAGGGEIFVCPDGGNDSQTSPCPPLSDLVCVNVPNTGLDLEFIEGPFSVKLSDEQFQAVNFIDQRATTLPTSYVPGADPTVCWWVFEDAPFGRWVIDYEVAVRVADNGDGTLTLRCHRVTGGGYTSNLIDKANDRQVLVTRSQMDGGPASEVVLGYGGGGSYGMNSEINSISDDVGKIAVLDYPWLVARAAHDWSSDEFSTGIPGIPAFARHHGRANVLFTGGSVDLKRPDEVNPSFHRNTLWDE